MTCSWWCSWCNHPTTVGRHLPGGKFDPESVPVSEEEIDRAERRTRSQGETVLSHGRGSTFWASHRSRENIRYNLSLGKHAGSYPS